MAQQLTLDLAFEPGLGVEDFLVSDFNADAVRMISRWPDWPDRLLLLTGPDGSGKTHLSTIFAHRSDARFLDMADLADRGASAALGSGAGPLILEDADRLTGERADEAVLFHLLNAVRELGRDLLVTARLRPDLWGIATSDLLSRLRIAPTVEIGLPDDALYRAVLAKLLHDRQLTVDPSVIEFLFLRCERSFAAARRIVEQLDAHSLQRRRRHITRPIAAEALQELGS